MFRRNLYYLLSQLIPAGFIEMLVALRMRQKAAAFFNAKFDDLAPKETRIATGNYRQKKWDFFAAAKLLLELNPSTSAALINEMHSNPKLKNIPAEPPIFIKAGILFNLILTVPHMAFGLTEEHMTKQVDQIATLIAVTNKPLLKDRFLNGPLNAAVRILKVDGRSNIEFGPAMIPFINFDLPVPKLALILVLLEKQDEFKANFFLDRLNDGKFQEVKEKMIEIKIKMIEKGLELKKEEHVEKEKENKRAIGIRDKSIAELAEKLAKLVELYLPEEKEKEEGEGGEEKKAEGAS